MASTDTTEADPGRARAAAALRRATMTVRGERVDDLASAPWDDIIDDLLDADTIRRHSSATLPARDRWDHVVTDWLGRMIAPDSGIVERLTWFWHNLLTTSADAVGEVGLVQRQLTLLQRESLGSFRRLLHAYTTDGATLRYLDGDGSEAFNPNENYARELMELFTIGRGEYSQDDVRAAARALAGWRVGDHTDNGDEIDDELAVTFHPDVAFVAPLVFLGEQASWDTTGIVDRLCDHPATARRIVSRLWADLVGVTMGEDAATEWGGWWQEQDLEILPLVDRILRTDEARTARHTRPRTGTEWLVAASAALDRPIEDPWWLHGLGQMPYSPPNVSGWPTGDHWLRPGSLLNRGGIVYSIEFDEAIVRANTTNDVLSACGIETVTPSTLAALDGVARTDLSLEQRAVTRWRLALNAPEFHLL